MLVSDVAEVRYGSAMRYGAVTRNGGGVVVSGITLMLKGENFQQVIKKRKGTHEASAEELAQRLGH